MFSGPLKSFRATHPSFVPATTITRILSGIRVRSSFQDAVAAPLFSPEEIAFLASPISNALAQADPNERVRFQVGSTESLGGTLFIDQSIFHFTLSRFHSPGQITETMSLTLSFVPVAAERGIETRQSWMIIEPNFPAIAIDYEMLAKLPDSPPSASFTGSPSDRSASPSRDRAPSAKAGQQGVSETQPTGEASQRNEELLSLRELVIKQAKELQTLKEEVESLRRQRSDQETTTSKPKIKKSVPR